MSTSDSFLRRLRLKLRGLTDRRGLDRELADEMASHVEMEVEEGMRRGLSEAEARRRARVAFGGVQRLREETQEQWAFRWLDDALRDLRHALRSFARSPVFTVFTVLTLALGLGATTALFSVLDGVLLAPPPFADADRLAVVWETDRASGNFHEPASVPDFLDFEERSRSLSDLAAIRATEAVWRHGDGAARRLPVLAVTPDLPPMLGIAPRIGRPMAAIDGAEGSAPVVWISHRLWRQVFAGDPAAVGKAVELNGESHTVAGVMPPGADFGFHQLLSRADYGRAFAEDGDGSVALWVPFDPDPEALPRFTHPIFVLARLAPGVSFAAADEELAAIASDLEAAYPENRNRGARVVPLVEVAVGPVRPALWLLTAVAALVLLIACINVVSLLLARSVSRRREVAVRTALGAGSARLGRAFLAEGLVLAAAAGALGLGGAHLALAAIRAGAPGSLAPRLAEVGLAPTAVAVCIGLSVAVGLVCGLVPWWQARRVAAGRGADTPHQASLLGALQGAGRGSTGGGDRVRLRSALVVAEMALAVILVVAAGLLLQSFLRVTGVDLGFSTAEVVKARVQLPAASYPSDRADWPDWPEVQAAQVSLLERLEALPGAAAVALAGDHPLEAGFTNSFAIEGREAEASSQPEIAIRRVSPGYFDTVGVPLLAGRGLSAADRWDASPVALLNRAAARRFFPDDDPVGQRLAFWGVAREVVGVVGDERFLGPRSEAPPALYAPLAQIPATDLRLLVRAEPAMEGDGVGLAASLAPALGSAVAAVDPALAVSDVETLEAAFGRTVARSRFIAALVGLFALLALLLALLGVHGVLAYTVARRRREMGIRMALGAARRDVLGLVLGYGLRLAVVGLGLGLAGAVATSRLLENLLFQVEPTDPATLAGVAAAVLVAAMVAALVPAVIATRTDPARTLAQG